MSRAAARSSRASARARNRTMRRSTPSTCSALYMPAQPGEMRPSARHAGHLGEHQRRAALRARAEMDEVEVVRRAVDRTIHRHRRDDDRDCPASTSRSRNGVNIGGAGLPARRRGARPMSSMRCDIALRSRSRKFSWPMRWLRVSRLYANCSGSSARIARDVLEPLHAVARRVLQAQHLDPALGFVRLERGRRRRVRERALRRARPRPPSRASSPSRSRSARCAPRRRAVRASRDDQRSFADDAGSESTAIAQMRRVRHQRCAVEIFGEQSLAERDRFVRRRRCRGPRRATSRRGISTINVPRSGVELVRVRPEPPVLGLLERERERVEAAMRAEPNVAVAPQVDRRAELGVVQTADRAVCAVGDHDRSRHHANPSSSGDLGLETAGPRRARAQRSCRIASSRLRAEAREPLAAGTQHARPR